MTWPIVINGNTYNEADFAGLGYLTVFSTIWNDLEARASDAEAAAVAAAAGAAALTATSSTSVAVGSGSKSFTASTGKSIVAGQVVAAVRTSAPSTYQMFGTVTSYNSGTGALVLNITDTVGSGTYSDWTIVPAGIRGATGASGASAVLLSVTGAATLGVSDKGKYVEITGASTFTLGFSAAATLASGWYTFVVHNGTGVVTLDPNSTEQIDGLTTFAMYPGEARLIQCTGTALKSVVMRGFRHSYTAAGEDSLVDEWNVPPVPEALRSPTFAIVTGSESDPFAVNVPVSVAVLAFVVCAYVNDLAIRPPPDVVICPVSDVSDPAGSDVFAVRPTYV